VHIKHLADLIFALPANQVQYAEFNQRTKSSAMRFITRRGGESFQIGNNIKVTVISIRGNKVEIGIGTIDDSKSFRSWRSKNVTPKYRESFQVADNVRIKVVSAGDNMARLEIDAPDESKEHRNETHERIRKLTSKEV
jgi:carbon storage regulator CsrA